MLRKDSFVKSEHLQDVMESDSNNDAASDTQVIDESVHLKKRMGILTGSMFIINYMVGTGIFVTPHFVLLEAGSLGASLLIWAFCGIIIICGCFTNVELGCMMPFAGGAYQYYNEALHEIVGYLFAWTYLVMISPSAGAAAALSFSNYLLSTWYSCGAPMSVRILFAIALIWLFVFLNVYHIRAVNILHRLFGAGKILTLIAIVVMGILGASQGGHKHFQNSFANTTDNLLTLSLAFHSVIFTFSGWNGLNFLAAELKDPIRSLPIASGLGLGIVVILYMLVNVSYFLVLTPEQMKLFPTTVVAFAEAMWKPLGVVFSILVSFSIMGFIASELNATSRITYGASLGNHMPCIFSLLTVSTLNEKRSVQSPILAIIANGILTTAYLAAVHVDILVYMTAFSESAFYLMLAITLFILRWKQPNRLRPFKAFLGFPILFAVTMILVIVVSLIASPESCGVAAGVILAGLLFYPLTRWRKPARLTMIYDGFTVKLQKLFIAAVGNSDENAIANVNSIEDFENLS